MPFVPLRANQNGLAAAQAKEDPPHLARSPALCDAVALFGGHETQPHARRRDPNFTTGHLCRFRGTLVPWGEILHLLGVDPDTPPYMRNESACHAACLEAVLRPGLALTFHRHWTGKAPLPGDEGDVLGRECAICASPVAPAALVRLRVQRPAGTVKAPEFDEQTLPLHAGCLARVSTSRLF